MVSHASERTRAAYLITGGAGFIGAHVAEQLLKAGARVWVIDDFNDYYDPTLKEAAVAQLARYEHFSLYRGDIRNKHAMACVFQDIGADLSAACERKQGGIIHLAARAGVRPSLKDPQLYFETNVNATLTLAELAKAYGIDRFVFASSSSVYGERGQNTANPSFTGFQETDDISKPISPYAASKIAAEQLLHTYAHLHNIQVVALRFFTVYGPRQRPDLAIHKFTRLIDRGQSIPVFGDGSARRDFTYIDDILQGILAALTFDQFTGASPMEIFNLGESATISVSHLIALIESALGKKATIEFHPAHPGDVSLTFANIGKANTLLGYHPETPIEKGIQRFVDWYQTQAVPSVRA
ncbi:MAG: NAD-dependent epimerase/dehydratase family protein [Vampirovibrionales bacterium]|nr:NAD-dependent epimerase/dehydratase family protein [Vampirovibrionales bacterium]